MAYLAQLGGLTDELVTIITSTSADSNPNKFNVYRESALRSLRYSSFSRTNQFEVEDKLRGLVERFAIVGREGLSEALRQRLDALAPQTTKWTPDALHFLLELSDKPTQKSKLRNLALLREPEEEPELQFRWEDIAKEDGWSNDRGLWKNIDYADNSDDDSMEDAQSQASLDSEHTSISSVNAQNQRTAKDMVLPGLEPEEKSPLEDIEETQAWRLDVQPKDASGRATKIPISELQVLREVLFMLNGLPTDLFGKDCCPVPKYQMANVSWDTYRALINSCAECGRTLLPLRKFCKSKQDIPLLQAFQDSISQRVRIFDQYVAAIQERFVDIQRDVVISLVAIFDEIKPSIASLAVLSDIIRQLQEERFPHAFRFLELMYDATCISQLTGDETTYRFLGTIFFDCFRVYIRPIRVWMEDGQLTSGDKTFFVSESTTAVPLNQVWTDKYKLLRTQDGILHAPRFLQPAVKKILNTGKSMVILRHLGKLQLTKDQDVHSLEPPFDFEVVCPPALDFAPFSELFSSAFDRWIQSKHHTTSATLQRILFESCGLWSSLDALQHIYFMSDGSVSQAFTTAIFSGLDALNSTWRDHFILTEFAQEAWSSCLDSYRISAVVESEDYVYDLVSSRTTVKNSLPAIRISYRLAWPVQLIITKESITSYQAVFTLLLQLRRATTLLTTSRLEDDSATAAAGGDVDEQAVYFGLRTRLLWFCNTLHTYLVTLVLVPEIARMRQDLQNAEDVDVDTMISVHSSFAKRVVDQACLGRKLEPIHECILDVFDLAIRLEDARRAERARRDGVMREMTALAYLQVVGTPKRQRISSMGGKGGQVYVSPMEKEKKEDTTALFGDELDGELPSDRGEMDLDQSYGEVLMEIRSGFNKHLKFIAGGLRGVARATSVATAGKWDILAEMLEMGISKA